MTRFCGSVVGFALSQEAFKILWRSNAKIPRPYVDRLINLSRLQPMSKVLHLTDPTGLTGVEPIIKPACLRFRTIAEKLLGQFLDQINRFLLANPMCN